MGVPFKREFQRRKFCFDSKDPNKFIKTQWRISEMVYIVWRLFWALWHIAWMTYSISEALYEGAEFKWLIYLTNLSYTVLTAQSWLHTILVCYVFVVRKKYTKEELKLLAIATHAFNSAYVLLDILLIAAPVRLLHLIYPSMYGAAYVTFTIIYHLCNGTNSKGEPYIYKSFDWSKPIPSTIIGLGSTFVAVPAVHLLQFGIYSLRLHIVQTPACWGKFAHKDHDICERSSNLEAENSIQTQMSEDVKDVVVQTPVELVAENKCVLDSHSVEIPEIISHSVEIPEIISHSVEIPEII